MSISAARFDRRFGERWTFAQTLKNWAIRGCVRAVLFLADRMPAALLVAVGGLGGRAVERLSPRAAETARERAGRALLEPAAVSAARACFAAAGRSLAQCLLLRREGVRARDYVSLSDASTAVLRDALARGRGAIVISAHVGPFEMIPARLVEAGFAPAIVVRESYDPGLDRVVDFHRRLRGVEVIHRGRRDAARKIVRALRQGRPVGVLPDLGGRGLSSVPARFLGHTVAFPTGGQRLARRTRSPIVIGTLARATMPGPPFELVFEELDSGGTAEELTQRVADSLARAIARSPCDWLWMSPPHLMIAAG